MPCECENAANGEVQKGVLWTLLTINAGMFLVEVVAGILAHSSALLADSVDMLADAAVYGLALLVSGKSSTAKRRTAISTGTLQGILGFSVLGDVIRRWIWGNEPEFPVMIVVGTAAAIANVVCLFLLRKHRQGEVHIRATWIFTRTDVLANLGTVLAGILIFATRSPYPDLIVGFLICLIILHGSNEILRDSVNDRN